MEDRLTPYEALKRAVEAAGSQSALARLCGVSQPTVWKWLNSTKRLPAEYVLIVEAELGISRHHLRPDIYPLGLQEGRPFPFHGGDLADRRAPVAFDRRDILQASAAA